MTLQIHSASLCLPIQKKCLVSCYDDQKGSWENIQLIQCNVNCNMPDDVEVECCAFSPCGKYIAVCLSKDLIIYSTSTWGFLSSIKTERKGVSVKFFPKSNIVLLAEKSGSIKFFKFYENRIEKLDVTLGHNSMLIEVLVTEDERFIATCDRDEKIRITNYPNVYNIQCYCLGHTQFVCSINFLQSHKNVLVSSSGDNTVRLWEITTGKELFKYSNSMVEKNSPSFYTKITSFEINKNQSLIAAVENNSDCVTLLKVTGDVKSGMNVELLNIIKHSATPYDIEFWQGNLVCLLNDQKYPIKVYNCKDNFVDNGKKFKNLSSKIIDHWDLVSMSCKKRVDAFPLLFQFKKNIDISDNVKLKKIRCE